MPLFSSTRSRSSSSPSSTPSAQKSLQGSSLGPSFRSKSPLSLLGIKNGPSSNKSSASSKLAPSTAMTTPQAAQAYLAALAARSSDFIHSSTQVSSSDSSSTYSSVSSTSSALPGSNDSYSLRNRQNSSNGGLSSDSTTLVKRARGRSLSQMLGLDSEETVYSNDYHLPIDKDRVAVLSKYPPKNASKIPPTRHFDEDPYWIPPGVDKNDPHALLHSEFGYNGPDGKKYQYESRYRPQSGVGGEEIEEPSVWTYIFTYMSFLMLIVVGHIRDFIGKRTHRKSYQHLMPYEGYAALNSDFDSFYTRRLKARIEDLFARPVTGVAGRTINCLDRISTDHYATFRFTGLTTQALNISSYNYLGFNQSKGGISDSVEKVINQYSVSPLGNSEDSGTLDLHVHAERLIAKFVGVEDALLVSQGFATNSATLPVLVSKGCLVISDEYNHASIRFGVRLSGATVRLFKHNDMNDLEHVLRESISQGQPRTHRPWKKILLVLEGLYSMEGTLVDLPRIMQLKRRYKFFIYLDEAHSVGALGPRGRGVCDYFGIDPNEVDIMMGTLTKSFGAAGGYIAASKEIISEMRKTNHSTVYGEAHSPAVLMQIIGAVVSIMGQKEVEGVIPASLYKDMPTKMLDGSEGLERLRRLAFNSRYLSTGLRKLGFIVYGHRDSPIVPLLMFSPGKMGSFSRLMLEKFNIVTVVVAYPATPLVSSRVRFCVSAAHTKSDIDRVLIACDIIGDLLGLKLSHKQHKRMKIQDIIDNAVELVESQ